MGDLEVGTAAPSGGGRARPWLRRGLLLFLALQALVGVAWVASNLGDVPGYVDSLEYVRASKTLEVDAYRGIAYPALLAAIDRLAGGKELVDTVKDERPERGRPQGRRDAQERAGAALVTIARSPEAIALQLLQLGVSAASLAFFLRTFVRPLGSGGAAATGGFLLLLVLLLGDPLLAHLQLSFLTDGLAFSASLVFCAAFARYFLGQPARWRLGVVLFLSAFLASALRVEKAWVLAGTVLATLAAWWLAERERAERVLSPARALQTAGIALAGALASLAVQQVFRGEGKRMPTYEFVLDQRVLFPYLSEVYDELPPDVRAHLSREEAREHDRDVVFARRGIETIGGDDPALRRALIESAAGVVLRERWPSILLDTARDVAENAGVTLSFYGHMGWLAWVGKRYGSIPANYNRWTYMQMSFHHPRTTQWHLALSGASFVLCTLLALVHVRRSRASGAPRIARALRLAWVPIVLFVLVNAVVFAVTSGLVHPRYAVVAHAAVLALVYRGALGWAGNGNGGRATS